MNKNSLFQFALASLFFTSTAHAAIDLIAIGSISGLYEDLSVQTAAPLENGIPGNRLGGLGSGLAHAGGNIFLAIPDRGPNAKAYNPLIDDTTSFIDRFQTFKLSLAPSDAGSALPYTLTPTLLATTLLSSKSPLIYGSGTGLNVGNGAPSLNAKNRTHYFTGRSDNFNSAENSLARNSARLDPEAIRVSHDGKSIFISDEYGPHIYQFDRATGHRIRVYDLPVKFAVTNLSPKSDTEISGNTVGRVANKGMEGLAITPNGKTLIGAMQSPLIQDGGTNAPITRIVTINVESGAVSEYAYELNNIGTVAKPKYPTVSEIVAINDHEFLVDERDGKGLGDNSTAVYKRIYHIDLQGAQEVSAIIGASSLAGKAVGKTLFLDVVAALNAKGINSNDIPAKLEGLAFGPDLVSNGITRHTLYIANDNDFVAVVNDTNHPNGIDNPNKFFVFAVDTADLPGYVPQQIKQFDVDFCEDAREIFHHWFDERHERRRGE